MIGKRAYIIFLFMVFIAGCSEQKNSQKVSIDSSVGVIETSKVSNYEASETDSDYISVLSVYENKDYKLYEINDGPLVTDELIEIVQKLHSEEGIIKEQVHGETGKFTALYFNEDDSLVFINENEHSFSLSQRFKEGLDFIWLVNELKTMDTMGLISLANQNSSNSIGLSAEKTETFLRESFDVAEANIEYIYIDDNYINAFKKYYSELDLAKDDKDMILEMEISPFVYFTIHPQIDGIPIFDAAIVSETTDYVNNIVGTTITVVVQNQEIQQFDIMNFYSMTPDAVKTVRINIENIINTVSDILENTLHSEKLTLKKIDEIYLPTFNLETEKYTFRPTLVFYFSEMNSSDFPPIFIDIETGEEVVR